MQIGVLDQKHPTYDCDYWADLCALYAGGKKFCARLQRMLVPNPMEPPDLYARRQAEACYRSYVGPIIDYYAAWLFADSFNLRSTDRETGDTVEADPWYAKFKEDVGSDIDLKDFMRDRFTEALIKQCAHWIVEFPSAGGVAPADKAEFQKRGLGEARLVKVDRECLYDWECDDNDNLLWCVVHCIKCERPTPREKRTMFVETWKVYDPAYVETYEIRYEKDKRPKPEEEARLLDRRLHGATRVPLVTLKVSDGLWIGGRVFAAQLEHFRLSCALAWAIRRSCYAMPILKLEDTERVPTMGVGYYMKLGVRESFDWAAPPDGPFTVTAAQVDAQRDEIYRITHQLALSLDGGSAAVGRSGESKEQDSLATRVMLVAYGSDVRESVEETFELISDGRGDNDVTFSVEGLDDFAVSAPADLVATATEADVLDIPSSTFKKEMFTRVAFALVPDVDQRTRETIKQEIDEGVEAAVELADELRERLASGEVPAPGEKKEEEPAEGEEETPPAQAPPKPKAA